MSDNEWYNGWERVTTNDNEWQRLAISANSSFFQIREESTTKHPKENFLNIKEDLEENRDIKLRAEGSPWEKILRVRSRNCRNSYLQVFLKIGILEIFAIFTEKHFAKVSFNTVAGLQACACNCIKKSLQRRRFPVNIAKFVRTAFFYRTPLVAASAIEIIL